MYGQPLLFLQTHQIAFSVSRMLIMAAGSSSTSSSMLFVSPNALSLDDGRGWCFSLSDAGSAATQPAVGLAAVAEPAGLAAVVTDLAAAAQGGDELSLRLSLL